MKTCIRHTKIYAKQKSRSTREVHNNKSLSKEIRKTSNKQYNFALKGTRKQEEMKSETSGQDGSKGDTLYLFTQSKQRQQQI